MQASLCHLVAYVTDHMCMVVAWSSYSRSVLAIAVDFGGVHLTASKEMKMLGVIPDRQLTVDKLTVLKFCLCKLSSCCAGVR